MKQINFLGLGFEVGQAKDGLKRSHDGFRQYFAVLEEMGLKMVDQGEVISHDSHGAKLHAASEVPDFNWQPYQEAYQKIQNLLQQPEVLLNWGGDHSVALATVGAFCAQNPTGYVVWVDAHADANLPEHSLSGNLHGMPLAILLNFEDIAAKHFPWIQRKLLAERLIYVGVRDLDPFEKEIIQKLGIKAFTAEDVRKEGMKQVARKVFKLVQDSPLHVSFDVDSLSPEVAPSTGVPVAEGLTLDEVKILGRTLSQHRNMKSVDIVEVNPALGDDEDVFKTYFAAMSFAVSLLLPSQIHTHVSAINVERENILGVF